MTDAVLIATSRNDAWHPLRAPVGGLPLLLRQARLLRAVGVRKITLLCSEAEAEPLREALGGRLGVSIEIKAVSGETAPQTPEVTRAVAELARAASGLLVLVAEWVLERAAVAQLIADAGERAVAVGTVDRKPVGLLAIRKEGADMAQQWLAQWRGPAVPPPGALGGQVPAAAGRGAIGPVPLAERDVLGPAVDEQRRQRAEHALWEGCRKPIDGITSRNINRHVSLFISKRIVGTAIDPNHISIFNLLLGITGAALAADGGYLPVLAGAIALKLNSVLDGVDGELARMRLQSSVLGEWLDTISDDLSNQLFFAGLAWGAYRTSSEPWFLYLGAAAVLPLMATSAYYYRWCYLHGRGDVLAFDWFRPPTADPAERARRSLWQKTTDLFTQIFRRDSFVMLLLIGAVFGVVRYALLVIAPAAIATLAALLLKHRARARAASTAEANR